MAIDRKISIADITGPVGAATQGQKDSLISALGIASALTDARQISNGDKGAFTVSGGVATLNGSAVMAAMIAEAGLSAGDLVQVNAAGDGFDAAEVGVQSPVPDVAASSAGAITLDFSGVDIISTTTTENITTISVTGLGL